MTNRKRDVLIAVVGLCLILLSLSPFLYAWASFANSTHKEQQRVKLDLDHAAIRNAGQSCFASHTSQTHEAIPASELPSPILETSPNYVHVSDGFLFIEYGGGHAHFGLAVSLDGRKYGEGQLLMDGIYYYEAE